MACQTLTALVVTTCNRNVNDTRVSLLHELEKITE